MKNSKLLPKPVSKAAKARELKLKILKAQQRAAAERAEAQAAKAKLKRARKAFKHAKKAERAARKKVRALEKTLSRLVTRRPKRPVPAPKISGQPGRKPAVATLGVSPLVAGKKRTAVKVKVRKSAARPVAHAIVPAFPAEPAALPVIPGMIQPLESHAAGNPLQFPEPTPPPAV